MENEPRILIIRRRYLGDIVLLGSLARNLRLHWPGARITVLVEGAYRPVLALNPDVDSVLELPARAGGWPGFLRSLRAERFTHVLDIDNTERTALVARLSGAPLRVALHHGSHPVKLRSLYTHVVHDPEKDHEGRPISDYYLRALEPIGVPVATKEIRLVPRPADVAAWRKFVGAQGRLLLVHPGSRSPARVWPADRFAAVCDRVQDELGAQVILVGGLADRQVLSDILSQVKTHVLSPGDAPTLPLLAALAKASTALLCHDSGPMHVAAAVGTPVVALYGSQNPRLFQPTGPGHRILVPPTPCAPCLAPATCVPGDSYRTVCVRHHSVDTVFQAVRAALAGSA
jgi:ADP-heptose:LPS heptosyltransferase